jgi:hypothetical protein
MTYFERGEFIESAIQKQSVLMRVFLALQAKKEIFQHIKQHQNRKYLIPYKPCDKIRYIRKDIKNTLPNKKEKKKQSKHIGNQNCIDHQKTLLISPRKER